MNKAKTTSIKAYIKKIESIICLKSTSELIL